MTTTKPAGARERILATAFDLFYRQGYRATGINQVIAESGVAKASFYSHFPSKDDLLVAYARETALQDHADLRRAVDDQSAARARFFAPLRILGPWLEQSGFRGCPFQNLAAEVCGREDCGPVGRVLQQHREDLLHLFAQLARDLAREEAELAGIDPDDVARTYLLLMEGAIAAAVGLRHTWPAEHAIVALERYLDTGK